MSRVSIFSSPLLLGFDHVERMIERATKAGSEGYPPYNIEQLSEARLRITVAVAGFDMDDLSVQLENNQLVIRGKRSTAEDESRVFVHRGIATRQFQRAFILSDDIEVHDATLNNGLLHIDLVRLLPETTVQTIRIKPATDARKNGKLDLAQNALTDQRGKKED